MRIAVCDDDKNDIAIIQEFIIRYDAALGCDVFHAAADLVDAHRREFYDLIFLDIEMKNMNGFEAAKQMVRNREKPLIIFVTKSSKYTILGYEVAFRYLIKPITYEQVEAVLMASLEQIVPKKLLIEVNGKNVMISTKDIYYFEVFDHNVRARTRNNIYDYRESLKNIEDMLSGGNFVRPHNSYLVNLEHVVSTTQSEFIMKDGRVISISRKRKDDVFRALHQYLRR
jgi:DNA-binding LytR/AlgR family response regulator